MLLNQSNLSSKLYPILVWTSFSISLAVLGLLAFLNLVIESNVNSVYLLGTKNEAKFTNQKLQINFKSKAVETET